MKLNTGAMLKVVGIGLVIELVMFGINQAVTLASGINSATSPQQVMSSGMLGVSLLLGCVGYILYGVLGAVYGWFAHRDQGAVDVGQTALGGGITVVIVAIIGTVINMGYSLASGTLTRTAQQAAGQTGGEAIFMASVVGGIVVVLSAGLGAAGGAIYAALAGRGQSQGAAPSV